MDKISTAGVLRLRATSAVSRDKSVWRSAQDDDFVGVLKKNIPNKLALMGLRPVFFGPSTPHGTPEQVGRTWGTRPGKQARLFAKKLSRFSTSNKFRVPHISLVFREMWDTTNLNLNCASSAKTQRVTAVASHEFSATQRLMGTSYLPGR
jgi:hypothetical protein